MAEQLAFDQLFRECGAVDRDERFVGAEAGSLDRSSDEFLTGAALALNQDGLVSRADALNQPKQLLSSGRIRQ